MEVEICTADLWIMALCSLAGGYKYVRRTCCLHLAGPSETVVALRKYQPDSHTLTVLNSLNSKCILIIRISEVIVMVFVQSDNFERGD